ncbi:hypothetical protein [Salegentibacter sp.]|uniref:hypothetical protein n=1 Tax=Salegentibacter sp. TaxID=1903072 RepID=UPI003562BB88
MLLSNFLVTSGNLEELKEPDIYSAEFEEEPNDPGEDPPAGRNKTNKAVDSVAFFIFTL